MDRVIGIDFGTSTTYMNVKRYNGAQPDGDRFSYMPVMFNYGESSGYVATIVRENADGSFDFGEKASEPLEGSRIHTEIKMRLESPDGQARAEARRITREFFKFLHEQYVQQAANLGGAGDEEETVVSYPVKWQKETAQFMLDAARDAGFRNVRGMDEAEAAVATVLCQNSGGKGLIRADKPGYLMLIDMGAGTTDLVVCRYQAAAGGQIAIELVTGWPHSANEPTFGGREIDTVLENYVEAYLTSSLIPALAPQAHIIAAAPGQAKMWKERNVSVTLSADKPVNTCAYIGTYKTMGMLTGGFPAFDRKAFEAFAEGGLRDYARLISGCLEQTAAMDRDFSVLDLVILTGGHSAWYFAREILTGTMEGWLEHPALTMVRENPNRVVSLPNPQTTVSLGLVYSRLPFKLEKKAAQKPEQDLPQSPGDVLNGESSLQKAEKQPSAEAKKPAETAADLRGQDETFSMRIDGVFTVSGQGVVVDGVIASGKVAVGDRVDISFFGNVVKTVEVLGIVVSKTRVSHAGKGDQVGILLSKIREQEIRSGMCLTASGGKTDQQPEPEEPAAGSYKWDNRLLATVKRVLQSAPDLKKTNKIQNTDLVKRMRSSFGLPLSEEILYVYDFDDNSGRYGYILSVQGIYSRRARLISGPKIEEMLWGSFLNSKENGNTLYSEYSYRGGSIFFSHTTIKTGMNKLYLLLRRESVSLQAGTRPVKQGSAGSQRYEWDDRLLPIVEQFIQEDPILRSRNEIHQYDVKKLAKKIELEGNRDIYYVTACGKGNDDYIIIYDDGFGLKHYDGYILGYSFGDHLSWEDFLNCLLEDKYSSSGKLIWELLHLGDSLSKLQPLLREKSVALQEGRPI